MYGFSLPNPGNVINCTLKLRANNRLGDITIPGVHHPALMQQGHAGGATGAGRTTIKFARLYRYRILASPDPIDLL